MRAPTLPDRALALVLLAIALGAIWHAQSLEVPFAGDPVGPRAFPTVIGAVLGVAALAIAIRPSAGWAMARQAWPGVVCVLAMLAYGFALAPLGFIIATALLCIVIARAFGGRWTQAVLVAVLTGPGLFLLLDIVLDLPLPRGPLGF